MQERRAVILLGVSVGMGLIAQGLAYYDVPLALSVGMGLTCISFVYAQITRPS